MSKAAIELRRLGPETFGQRLRRAREASQVEFRAAADAISEFAFVSTATLARFERLDDLPADRRRRALVYLAVVTYGFDPTDFGLSDAELPGGLDPKVVRRKLTARSSSGFRESR